MHQASFRDAVLSAYGGRCAISHLPEPRLLDAAHIVMDADEQLGQPIVSNGLPLTKIHHAAFDAHLIGDPLQTKFEKRTVMDFEQPVGDVNSVIGVDADQVGVEGRMVDLR